MEKSIKRWLYFALMGVVMAVTFTACSSDDDDEVTPAANTTEAIAGVYTGQLNMVGMASSEAERAYVTLTRKSSSSVSCKIESEGWGVDMESVNLSVSFVGDIVNLESETSKSISGQIISGNLQLTYETGAGYVFQFLGSKD